MGIQINGSTDRITAIDGTIDFVSNIGNIGLITASNYVLQDAITIGAGSTIIKTVNGKLGIGTDVPTYKLHVDSGDAAIGLWKSRRSSGSYIDYALGANGAALGYIGAGGQIIASGADSADFAIRSEGDLCFASGGSTERFRITSDGNIGAGGITTPLWTSGGGIHLNDNYGIGFGDGGSGRPDFQLMVTDGSTLQFRCGFGADTADINMDTSGRLLIGTSSASISSSELFEVKSSASGFSHFRNNSSSYAPIYIDNEYSDTGFAPFLTFTDGGGNRGGIGQDNNDLLRITGQGGFSVYTAGTHGGGNERFRIDGTTGDIMCYYYNSLFSQTGLRIYNDLSGGPQLAISRSAGNPMLLNRNTSDGEIVDLRRGWGAGGSIHVGTNSATYNTSSDYRLKENVVPISDAITRLKTLKPSRFNWIGDTNSTRDGFLAHEVTAVPEAITGTKDEVYLEDEPGRNIKAGDPKYQGIDQSRLVPLLTAALQEAIARIEALEG